jgi:hypothetical protein
MKKTAYIVTLILVLLASAVASLQFVGSASANPDGSAPKLAMPVEYVNYTIVRVNGTLWAQIDGEYPIYLQNTAGCEFNGELPMVYPMPPGTTDIHVWLGDQELAWSNYTQAYAGALHHTAIGDWWMIYAVLENVSDFFVLRIHYEHPLEVVNSSYLFLYDLNISPYLSAENSSSTAYFTVHMDANATDLHVYTAPPDSPASEWQPQNYTANVEGSTDVVAIQMHSEYSTPLVGDLVVEFSDANQVPEFPLWTMGVLILVLVLTLVMLLYLKRRAVTCCLGLSKTASSGNN